MSDPALFALRGGSVLGEPKVFRDLEYAKVNQHSLLLDLYLPADLNEPVPVVIFIHGGGWKNGSKDRAKNLASWLTDHQIAVAGINYRLTDVASWPAQIDDCYAAVRWLRQHAGEYRLDAGHIGVWGTSAGAHLAVLLGMRPNPSPESVSSRVQAVCDWFGPADLLTMPPNLIGGGRTEEDVAKSNGAMLLRETVREAPAKARDASGLYHVSADDPPILIMHGDQDPGVPVAQSQRLASACRDAGISVELNVVAGAGHGGEKFRDAEVRDRVLDFFKRTLDN